jgi:glycosyltransferase involved in cell wall biosynthesis/cytochrome c-type biogenesis protein CcmH/NrfG
MASKNRKRIEPIQINKDSGFISLIFSKDRPLQLSATLESFLRNCRDYGKCNAKILWKSSTGSFSQLYGELIKEYQIHSNIKFIEETDFNNDVLKLIKDSKYVLWIVDGNIFIREFSLEALISALNVNNDAIGISLRLGKNTTYCYPQDKCQQLPKFIDLSSGLLKYKWKFSEYDFGYPLEVSSSIYRTSDLFPFLSNLKFRNPNELESQMAYNANAFSIKYPSLICPNVSYTFCNPVNIDQNIYVTNRNSNLPKYYAKKLAQLFIDGKRIDIDKYQNMIPNACHQVVDLKFKKIKADRNNSIINEKAKFSIIMANYNKGKYIDAAIKSVLNQSFIHWELIIVDDGSTDDSIEIITSYLKDKRIKLIKHSKNSGIIASQITGINSVSSNFFGTLDSDDALAQNAIETMHQAHLNNPEASLIYSQFMYCDHNLKPVKKGYCAAIDNKKTNLDSDKVSHFKTFKKSFYDKTQGYDYDIVPAEDKDISYKLEEVGSLIFIDKVLYYYRHLSNSISHNRENKKLNIEKMLLAKEKAIYRRHKTSVNTNKSALQYFRNANKELYEGNFVQAEAYIEKYKKLIKYDSFVKHDKREAIIPKLSIVIVAYKTKTNLIKCIISLLSQSDKIAEIIVVDNGDNNEVLKELLNLKIMYVRAPENLILSEGRNIGVHYSKGEIVAFIDDDAIAGEKYVSTIIEAFKKYNIVGMRGKVLPKTGSSHHQANHYDLGNIAIPSTIDTEGNSAFLKSAYCKINGMNPLLFGMEGLDTSYRLANEHGANRIIYWPSTIIYHDYGDSKDKVSKKLNRYAIMQKYVQWKYPDIYPFHFRQREFIKSKQLISQANRLIPINVFIDQIHDKKGFSNAIDSASNCGSNHLAFIFQPRITIAIPTHKRPSYLREAIKSALQQNFDSSTYEILVVSDGHHSETKAVINEFYSNRMRFIQKEHSGAVDTRNRAIDEAKGDYILWLDDDDILEPTTLSTYLKTLSQHPHADVIYGILEYFDDLTGNTLRYFEPSDWSIKPETLLGALSGGCRIPNPATLIRKSAYQEVGKYDRNFKRAHDYEFWSRAASSLSFKKCNSIVCRYRVHTDNMSVGDGVDLSYESLIIRKMVNRYGAWNLFPELDWGNPELAESAAKFIIAKNLYKFGDYFNSLIILNKIPHKFVSKEIVELHFFCSLFQGLPNNTFINSALSNNKTKVQYDHYKRLNKRLIKSLHTKNTQQCIQNLNEYRNNNLSPSVDLLVKAGKHLIARGERRMAKNVVTKACLINPEAVAANKRMLDNFDELDHESINGTIQRVISPEGLNRFADTDSKQTNRIIAMAETVSMDDAVVLCESENYRDAFETLSAYISRHPHDWSAYALLVDVMLHSGQAAAIPDKLRPMEQCGELPSHMLALLGSGYEAAGDLVYATDYANRALSADSDCARARNLKGVIAFRSGNMEEAAHNFQAATENDPAWGEPWTNLGTVYWEQGHHNQALESLEKGFNLSPTAPNVVPVYHAALSETGQYERAKPVFEEVIGRHPNFKKARYLLIDILIRLEAYADALLQIESLVVRFGPEPQLLEAAKTVRAKVGPETIRKYKHPSLSLCMIVKNEEKYLPKCLESLKPLVDEMIVVDTGSTDTTRDIAEVFGAKVFDFQWQDDFAAARNHSLDKSSGDWILIMDADEVIAPEDHKRIHKLIRNSQKDKAAFLITTRNYTSRSDSPDFTPNKKEYIEEQGKGWVPSQKVRLFQNNNGIHFVFPVHEQVDPVLLERGIPIQKCPFPVHHYGKLDARRERDRWQIYYEIGKKKLVAFGDSEMALKEMAIQASLLSHWSEAASYWNRYLELKPDCFEAHLHLTRVMAEIGDFRKAHHHAAKAAELSRDYPDPLYNLALTHLQIGQAEQALQTTSRMCRRFPDNLDCKLLHSLAEICAGNANLGLTVLAGLSEKLPQNTIVTRTLSVLSSLRAAGCQSYITILVNALTQIPFLEAVAGDLNNLLLKKCNAALPRAVDFDAATNRLFQTACQAYEKEDFFAVKNVIQQILTVYPGHWPAYKLLFDTLLQSGQEATIPAQLRQLEQRSDLPPMMLSLVGSGYEAAGDLAKAADYANQAISITSECGQTWNLKGMLAFRNGDMDQAGAHFQTSIEKDASWGEPWTNLGSVYWERGNHNKALETFEKGFDLSPTAPNVATAYHAAIRETGQYERAKPLFETVVEKIPHFKKARFLLIDILIHLEAYANALAQIESLVVRFGPDEKLLQASKAVRAKVGPVTIKKGKRPSLSLCMIVKNEEKHLPRCLENLKLLADEMIVVDTGSIDTTRDIAEVFGAKVFDFEWNDDFAAARNYSLEKASGDWILVMDADEIIASKDHKKFRKLIRNSKKDKVAYLITTRNYTHKFNGIDFEPNDSRYEDVAAGCGWIPSAKTRLFKNASEIRFNYPVHELVDPALDRNGYQIKKCNLPVHHYGILDKSKSSQKGQYYYEIGKKKIEQVKDDPMAIHELAIGANLMGKQEEAIDLWNRVALLQPNNARTFINLSAVYAKVGNYRKAKSSALRAVEIDPKHKAGHYNLGRSQFFLGNFIGARKIFQKIVHNDRWLLCGADRRSSAYPRPFGFRTAAFWDPRKTTRQNPSAGNWRHPTSRW